jgi:hypothetical protein
VSYDRAIIDPQQHRRRKITPPVAGKKALCHRGPLSNDTAYLPARGRRRLHSHANFSLSPTPSINSTLNYDCKEAVYTAIVTMSQTVNFATSATSGTVPRGSSRIP